MCKGHPKCSRSLCGSKMRGTSFGKLRNTRVPKLVWANYKSGSLTLDVEYDLVNSDGWAIDIGDCFLECSLASDQFILVFVHEGLTGQTEDNHRLVWWAG